MNNKVSQSEVLLLLASPHPLHNFTDIEYNKQPVKKLLRLNNIKSQLKYFNHKHTLLRLKKISSIVCFLNFSNNYSGSQIIDYLCLSFSKLVSIIFLADFKNIFCNSKVLTNSLKNFSANYHISKHYNTTNCLYKQSIFSLSKLQLLRFKS